MYVKKLNPEYAHGNHWKLPESSSSWAFITGNTLLNLYWNSIKPSIPTNIKVELQLSSVKSILGSIIRKGSKQNNKAKTPLLITWANLVLSINDHSPEDLLPTATTMPAKAVSDTETSAKDN